MGQIIVTCLSIVLLASEASAQFDGSAAADVGKIGSLDSVSRIAMEAPSGAAGGATSINQCHREHRSFRTRNGMSPSRRRALLGDCIAAVHANENTTVAQEEQ